MSMPTPQEKYYQRENWSPDPDEDHVVKLVFQGDFMHRFKDEDTESRTMHFMVLQVDGEKHDPPLTWRTRSFQVAEQIKPLIEAANRDDQGFIEARIRRSSNNQYTIQPLE